MALIIETGVFTNPEHSDIAMLGNHHRGRSNREVLPAGAAIGQDTAWWHSEHEDVFQHGSENITKDDWTLIPDFIALNKNRCPNERMPFSSGYYCKSVTNQILHQNSIVTSIYFFPPSSITRNRSKHSWHLKKLQAEKSIAMFVELTK